MCSCLSCLFIGDGLSCFCCIMYSVVFQSADERNYHIFYQLCTVADADQFLDFHLGMKIMEMIAL